MLVEAFTYKEREAELSKDFYEIHAKMADERRKIRKKSKTRQTPGDKTSKFSFTASSGNVWTAWIRTNLFKPEREYVTMFTKMNSRYGLHYFSVRKFNGRLYFLEIRPHVIKRIRERCVKEVPQDVEELIHTLFLRDELVITARANRDKDENDRERGLRLYDTVISCFHLGCLVISMQSNGYMLARTFMDYEMMYRSRNREVFSLISNLYVERNRKLFDVGKVKSSIFYIKNKDNFYRMKNYPCIIMFPFSQRIIDKPKWMSFDSYVLMDAAFSVKKEYDIPLQDALEVVAEMKITGKEWTKRIERIFEKNGYVFDKNANGKPISMAKIGKLIDHKF